MYLQKPASIQPRTSPPKIGKRLQNDVNFVILLHQVRYAAAAFYDRVPAGPAAVDRLLAAAHDPLPHVQKAAVRALGRVEVACLASSQN